MSSEELRPCPFCGGRGAIVDVSWEYELMGAAKGGRKWWNVMCVNCEARTSAEQTQKKAVDAWNRRSDGVRS